MAGQPGFFDSDERLKALSAAGDPLERLSKVVDFEVFRGELEAALSRSNRAKGDRPPYDPVLMFKVLLLQTLYRMRRHRLAAGLLALELRPQPTALEEGQVGGRAVGGGGPHRAGGVVPIKRGAELTAVVSRRMGDGVAAQKAEGAINADVRSPSRRQSVRPSPASPWPAAARQTARTTAPPRRPAPTARGTARSICARHGGFHSDGTPPPLIGSFSAWVSRSRRASVGRPD
jgi:hypothetical protein